MRVLEGCGDARRMGCKVQVVGRKPLVLWGWGRRLEDAGICALGV